MLKECASNKVYSGGERVCYLLPSFFTSLITSSLAATLLRNARQTIQSAKAIVG